MSKAVRSSDLTYVGGYIPQSEADLIDAFAKSRLTRKGKPISRTVAVRMLCLMGLEREGLLAAEAVDPCTDAGMAESSGGS